MASLIERIWRLFGGEAKSGDLEAPSLPVGICVEPEDEAARVAPLVSAIVGQLGASIRGGQRGKDVEKRAVALLRQADLAPRMLGFQGFPAALNFSIEDEVCHGIPSGRVLEEGQLVTLQVGAHTRRGSADQGWTFAVGEVDGERTRLLLGGMRALEAAIGVLGPGVRTGTLGHTIQTSLEASGLSPVREYVGYGVGAKPIQAPSLPCYGAPHTGPKLAVGMVLHVHVIATLGSHEVFVGDDGWTVHTRDGRPGGVFTAMARITEDGCDVLSRMPPG